MSTSITFNDGSSATLTNGQSVPGDRFSGWTPNEHPHGESANLQANGALVMFAFRIDYVVALSLGAIPSKRAAGTSLLDIANRLRRHLMNGGTCSVQTGDADSHSYATCGLAPGATCEVKLSDAQNLEYTFTATLINLAGSPGPFLNSYANQ